MRLLVCALCAGLVTAATPLAHAQTDLDLPTTVVLGIGGCEAVETRSLLRRLIVVELRADGVSEVIDEDPNESAIARIDVTSACEGATATVRVLDLATDKRLERQVQVADVSGDARARVLAFAVAALLRASWAELVLSDAPESTRTVPEALRRGALHRAARGLQRHLGRQLDLPEHAEVQSTSGRETVVEAPTATAVRVVEGPGPLTSRPATVDVESASPARAPQEAAESRTAPPPNWHIGAMVSARLFLQQPTGAVGGRVFVGFDWFRAGVSGEGALVHGSLGTVAYGLLTGDVEAQLLAHRFGGLRDPSIAMRARISIGWIRFQGYTKRHDVDTASLDAFVFGGDVVGALRVPLLEEVALELEVSLGAMTGGKGSADGETLATGEGLYGRFGIGIAY